MCSIYIFATCIFLENYSQEYVRIPQAGKLVPLEANQCGPNCLFWISQMLGPRETQDSISERFLVNKRGVSMDQIVEVAHAMGLNLAAVRYNVARLNHVELPAILHFSDVANDGHFMVLLQRVSDDDCEMIDGTTGERFLWNRGDLLRYWTGYAIIPQSSDLRHVAWGTSLLAALTSVTAWIQYRLQYRTKETPRQRLF